MLQGGVFLRKKAVVVTGHSETHRLYKVSDIASRSAPVRCFTGAAFLIASRGRLCWLQEERLYRSLRENILIHHFLSKYGRIWRQKTKMVAAKLKAFKLVVLLADIIAAISIYFIQFKESHGFQYY